MSRMKRDIEFTSVRISEDDHQFLISRKRGSSEQLDAVLHRIIMEFANSEKGDLEFLYNEQVKITQNWMLKCHDLEVQLRARNMVLDEVIKE